MRLVYQASIDNNDDLLFEAGAQAARFFTIHEALGRRLPEPRRTASIMHRRWPTTNASATASATLPALRFPLLADVGSGSADEAQLAHMRFDGRTDRRTEPLRCPAGGRCGTGDDGARERIRSDAAAAAGVDCHRAHGDGQLFPVPLFPRLVRPTRRLAAFLSRARTNPLEIVDRFRADRADEIAALGSDINPLLDQLQATGVSRDFVGHIFDSAPLPLLLVDSEQRVRRCNVSARQLHGGNPEGERIDLLLSGFSATEGEADWLTADGARVPCWSRFRTFRPADRWRRSGGRLADLTLRKEAEAATLRRAGLLKAVADAGSLLLTANSAEHPIPEALRRIGSAIRADRGSVVEGPGARRADGTPDRSSRLAGRRHR